MAQPNRLSTQLPPSAMSAEATNRSFRNVPVPLGMSSQQILFNRILRIGMPDSPVFHLLTHVIHVAL